MEDISIHIAEIVSNLPDKPGVYQYYDKKGELLYIGKAKNLKKRVSSYFVKIHDSFRLRVLVRKIADIKLVLVDSEQDALLLENNLIKELKPRYNINLRDDKTYPSICIKKERFPRVFTTRNIINDGSIYFGPYASVTIVRTLLNLIKQIYPIRTCTYNLSKENIDARKFKVCLEYHLGNCKGPCENLQSEEDYNANIEQIVQVLKGNFVEVMKFMKEKMNSFAQEMNFEEADRIKSKISIIENFQSKSTIVNQSIDNVDVFSIVTDDNSSYVNFLKVAQGAIVQSHTVEIRKKLDESEAEMLLFAVNTIRLTFNSTAPEVIVPIDLDWIDKSVRVVIPKIGDKKKLLDLSRRNAKFMLLESRAKNHKPGIEKHIDRILLTIKSDLRLSELPTHIECFDNSNIQGTNPVASCVVFKNGKPSKKDYRHFNIKTVTGPDDFASMEEVVYRRYKRLLDENQPLPQLIIIDGGKGQLHSAMNSLQKLELQGKIAVIGIAKRLEEIFFPGDSVPIYIDKSSETLKTIQYLRNEAHRFGIAFHRQKRSGSFLISSLDEVKGIGPKTRELLMKHFKSVESMKSSNGEELEKLIGKRKKDLLLAFFNKNDGLN